jgi:FkbM family methyltransferase
MKNYSQNQEDIIVQNYFQGYIGKLLSIGENDGITLSNSRALIELGWKADLVEPSPTAYKMLENLYKKNDNVTTHKVAIGKRNGFTQLFDMGTHLGRGDTSLLSTIKEKEMERWRGTEFKPVKVKVMTYDKFTQETYDFISIDAEGMDIDILKQINLDGVKCLCIEYNNDRHAEAEIRGLVPERFKEIYRSLENLVYAL